MTLSTIGSIADNVYNSFDLIPSTVSGTVLIDIVDAARQTVANYTNQTIGSNSIQAVYQPAILNLSKADVIGIIMATAGAGGGLQLSELSINGINRESAAMYQELYNIQLRSLGRGNIQFAKSLS